MISTNATLVGELQRLGPQSRVLQFASFTFDAVLVELVYTLVNGGCLCIPKEAESRAIVRTMNEYHVNWASLTPSVARTIDPVDVPKLQTLVLGGEAMQEVDITAWAGYVFLINSYGPTESTVDSHVNITVRKGHSNNIGPAIAAVSWVVDPDNVERLLPLGAPGELLIEGPIVGRGYLNDPEKTAAAFIAPPSWLQIQREGQLSRLYRTGDLVRFSSQGDSSIQYLGRKDSQVKLRGQRIELGEVEYHLRHSFPESIEVVAEIIKPTHAGAQPVLTAFIHSNWEEKSICKDEDTSDAPFASPIPRTFQSKVAEAESKLRRLLLPAMVPGLFIPLLYVPLNMSDKADRRVLRNHASSLSLKQLLTYQFENSRAVRRLPSTPFEMTLHDLVARVLDVSMDSFGMDNDFVRLGGDSILAMRLVGLAYKCGLAITVADVFTHTRLADLAMTMRSIQDDSQQIPPFGLVNSEELEFLLNQAMEECDVQKDQIEDMYPCTPLQEGLLVLTMGSPESYVADHGFRLSKDIDIDIWLAAWRATFHSNPILRTRIIQSGETSFQVVLRDEFALNTSDCIPTDLTQRSMGFGTSLTNLAVTLQSDGQYECFLTIHHALYDGWSLPLILHQVEEAYRGRQLQSRPFSQFIGYLANQDLRINQEVWKSLLSGFEGPCFPSLPSNSYVPSPTVSLQHTIPASGFAVRKSTAITLAWAVVLSQYTGSNDVVFGVTTSGRDAPVHGIDTITGPTITTHPFRALLLRDKSLLEAMQGVDQQYVNTIGAQHLGLQNIRRLGPDAASACKFQNLLIIQPRSDGKGDTDRLFTPLPTRKKIDTFATYALTLECSLSEASVGTHMIFDDSLISSEQAQRLLSQFSHVLTLLQSEVSLQPLEILYSLNPQDVSLLSQWTEKPTPRVHDLVHRQFGSTCVKRANEKAVCAWDGDFTYIQLDELSSQLALHLQTLGAGPEIFIPVCLQKTRWVVVAVLAIIKSGAAFVLLDPSFPTERLKGMCEDVEAKIMITSTDQQIPSATQQLTTHVVDITYESRAWLQGEIQVTAPQSCVQPHNALYCAFTSGSSGRPKGVVIEHVAFCTVAAMCIEKGIVTPETRILQFASFAFDPCITDILGTLLVGGCICIPSERERREDLAKAVSRMQVNHMDLTPSVFRTMAPGDFPTVKKVVLGGESMSMKDVRDWEKHAQLLNLYGPTECTVTATVQSSITAACDLRNIGHSLAGNCWVVSPSDHNKLVPIGAIGELVIGGAGVGRGYVNNPEASAAAFLTSEPPWLREFQKDSEDTRLYKTGDLVQSRDDGSFHFLGRKDLQVKIRGQRVEIGEVESAIQQLFPMATGAAVELVQSRKEGSAKILTGFIEVSCNDCGYGSLCHKAEGALFVAPCSHLQKELAELERKLQERLPVYMVPSRLLVMHSLPTNSTGKADRRRLQEQASSISLEELACLTTRSQQRRLPVSSAEEIVLQVCAQVLNLSLDSIGMDDSFFQLGGDSIVAIQFTSQCRKRGVVFHVGDIFRSPKLEDIASIAWAKKAERECIESRVPQLMMGEPFPRVDVAKEISASSDLTISADSIEKIYPQTDGQILRLHEPCVYFALHMSGGIDLLRLNLACRGLMQRYETLRSIFQMHKSIWVQVVLRQLELHFERYETDNHLVSFVENICKADKISIPATNIPIAKFFFVQGPDQTSILTIRLSHAQYDGYSFQTLCRDLKSLYESLPLGDSVAYSVHLQHWTWAQATTKALEFWKYYLNGFQMSHTRDDTRPVLANSVQPYMIKVENQIAALKPPTGITQATLVKTAWALTLSLLCGGADDITFGLTTTDGIWTRSPRPTSLVSASIEFLFASEFTPLCLLFI